MDKKIEKENGKKINPKNRYHQYIIINFDSVALKCFMDSGEMNFYGKKVCITPSISGDENILKQMFGNLGAYPEVGHFNKDVDWIIFSDKVIEDLKNEVKNDFIELLKEGLNKSNTPYRKLKFASEELLLDYMTKRATNTGDKLLLAYTKKYNDPSYIIEDEFENNIIQKEVPENKNIIEEKDEEPTKVETKKEAKKPTKRKATKKVAKEEQEEIATKNAPKEEEKAPTEEKETEPQNETTSQEGQLSLF